MGLNEDRDSAKRKKTIGIWVLLIVSFALVYWFSGSQPQPKISDIPASKFYGHIEKGEMAEVYITGASVVGELKPAGGETSPKQGSPSPKGKTVRTVISDHKVLVKLLREHHVTYSEKVPSDNSHWIYMLIKIVLPLIILILIFRGMGKTIGGQMNQQKQFTATKAIEHENVKQTFADVAGIDEAVDDAADLVHYLRDPLKFTRLGGRPPKGILFTGLPGTGKTLLARAVAGEAKVPFFSISGSEFVEMFVGVGASRVRDLFKKARERSPCIVFIDEIDAVGRHRGGGIGNSHDEREQTLNQLLVEMDGFEANAGIIIIAATNRPDILDPGLTRAGRFDRQVHVPMPDVSGRERIFAIHAAKLKLADSLNYRLMAQKTPGMSGADIEELCNEAALHATKLGKAAVDNDDFDFAVDKVRLGAERKGVVLRDKERRIVAYHEAGHAIAGWHTSDCDPVDKVTIVPRGQALGLTHFLPEDDRHIWTRQELMATIIALLGGRAAEMLLGTATTGASNDLERATEIAKQMVMRYSMCDDLPLRTFGPGNRVNPWQETEHHEDYGQETAQRLDAEVAKITGQCWEKAKQLVQQHHQALDALATALLERETVDVGQLKQILGHRPKNA